MLIFTPSVLVLSTGLILSRLVTGSLWLAIGWHTTWDFAQWSLFGISPLWRMRRRGDAGRGRPPVLHGLVEVPGQLASPPASERGANRIVSPTNREPDHSSLSENLHDRKRTGAVPWPSFMASGTARFSLVITRENGIQTVPPSSLPKTATSPVGGRCVILCKEGVTILPQSARTAEQPHLKVLPRPTSQGLDLQYKCREPAERSRRSWRGVSTYPAQSQDFPEPLQGNPLPSYTRMEMST